MDHRNPARRREHAALGIEVPIAELYEGIALAGDAER
jgi:hypothetical protein